ncbi:MAG: enoyl-CoA hydratase [Acidimicrobiia bacterium]
MAKTLRTETRERVRSIILSRPNQYNTITPSMRDELSAAIDEADRDPEVRVILLRAEGPAFCAGYGLDWATLAQSKSEQLPQRRQSGEQSGETATSTERVWDSVQDYLYMSRFVDCYMKLWYAKKPTIAAVHGWCIGGGTDLVLCADIIVAAHSAKFGYPPSRVWGIPTTAMWVYRLGLEKAKRYLLTGDEISAETAAQIGLILEAVPDDKLESHSFDLARRMAMLPLNQLIMIKLLCNQTVENMGFFSSRVLGTIFDGVARHTQEGLDFVQRALEVGWRQAVRERDDPFGDYGSAKRPS